MFIFSRWRLVSLYCDRLVYDLDKEESRRSIRLVRGVDFNNFDELVLFKSCSDIPLRFESVFIESE